MPCLDNNELHGVRCQDCTNYRCWQNFIVYSQKRSGVSAPYEEFMILVAVWREIRECFQILNNLTQTLDLAFTSTLGSNRETLSEHHVYVNQYYKYVGKLQIYVALRIVTNCFQSIVLEFELKMYLNLKIIQPKAGTKVRWNSAIELIANR